MKAWIDERMGLSSVWRVLLERKIPEARGAVAWLYTFGSILLFLFSAQVVTGALLAMSYAPTPDHAYDSVKYTMEQLSAGRLIRGMHHWGASFMVFFAAAHLLRTYFMGAYKYPREATWMTGALLFLFIMAFSFTGYLLPWDQRSYWATAVGTNIAGQTPWIGPAISKVLKGGDSMGSATLTRFYAFHALVLPVLVGGFILVHLFLVVWHGISETPERRRNIRPTDSL